ncbi:MAG: hypothetical protein H0U51_00035 [Propionibacteriales bacterium]|nr:hypothetical protein [Propionibacteriales bacterium]
MSSSWPPPPDQPPGGQPGQPQRPAQPQQPPPQQPPHGWRPSQPQQPGSGWQPVYPQQTLSQQEVKPGRNRKPVYIGVLVAAVLIIGGVVAWQLLKDDGEDTRAAYCSALRDLTNDGDLMLAISTADASSLSQIESVHQLAPNAVRDDWDTLQTLVSSAQNEPDNIDVSAALKALTALRAISSDAESECGITMDVPGLP